MRTGARALPRPAEDAALASPFDYADATRGAVVHRRRSATTRARWPRPCASCSWPPAAAALGLFTAIRRLRAVHERIAAPLPRKGLALYAQHVDPLEVGALVDIFRAEEDACLLGTDAVRDGVDVPGRSLRLLVFDRVPWPRPDILHKAPRRPASAARAMTTLARAPLAQAFGRLIRRADDKGVFVMLDAAADAAVRRLPAGRQHRAGGPGRSGDGGEGLSRSPGILSRYPERRSRAATGDNEILSALRGMALKCPRPCPLETCGLTQWSLNRSVALRSSRDG